MKKAMLILCSTVFVTGMGGDCNDMGMPAAEEIPQGSCCMTDGSCAMTVAEACTTAGGVLSEGTDCSTITCAQPGACCAPNGSCSMLLESDCVTLNQTFRGGQCEDLIFPGFLDGQWRGVTSFGIACLTITNDRVVQVDDGCIGIPNQIASPEPITITGNRVIMNAVVVISTGPVFRFMGRDPPTGRELGRPADD